MRDARLDEPTEARSGLSALSQPVGEGLAACRRPRILGHELGCGEDVPSTPFKQALFPLNTTPHPALEAVRRRSAIDKGGAVPSISDAEREGDARGESSS